MHVGLTEILRCPRCHEGLVLLSEEASEGRVASGRLGCAGCGARYPIRAGVADLRGPEATDLPRIAGGVADLPGTVDPEPLDGPAASAAVQEGVPLAALLGLADARGVVLLAGGHPGLAGPLAALSQGVEVVTLESASSARPAGAASRAAPEAGIGAGTADPRPAAVEPEADASTGPAPGWSRLRIGAAIPVADRRVAAIAVEADGEVSLDEAVRVLAPGGRIVVSNAGPAVGEALERLSCRVLAEGDGTVVGEREGVADPPRLYQLA